jgi:hypothetical protein
LLRYPLFNVEATLDNFALLALVIAASVGLALCAAVCVIAILFAVGSSRSREPAEFKTVTVKVPVSEPPAWNGSPNTVRVRVEYPPDKDPIGKAQYMPRPNPAATTWEDIPTPPTTLQREMGPDEGGVGMMLQIDDESSTVPPQNPRSTRP